MPTGNTDNEATRNTQDMTDQESNPIYDEVLYGDDPFPSTHPDTLSSRAILFGLQSAHPNSCRVLELGAAQGNNLISLAYQLPESEFVGIELSKKQVENGNTFIETLGLKNIRLLHKDILQTEDELGTFDYIISHGTLSWVPETVRQQMFALSSKLLRPHGVVYLSYNTFPGWHSRLILRDIMLFQGRDATTPLEKVKRARQALEIVARSLNDNRSPFAELLKEDLPQFQNKPDWYFIHDFIAEYNRPLYFSEFMDYAQKFDLQYLSEIELSKMITLDLPLEAQNILRALRSDKIRYEQYLDIARNRMFRRTLLCKASAMLENKLSPEQLRLFYLGGPFSLAEDKLPGGQKKLLHPSGGAIVTADPGLTNVLMFLGENYPKTYRFEELVQIFQFAEKEQTQILEGLWRAGFADLLEFKLTPCRFETEVAKFCQGSRLAQAQAKNNARVFTLQHEVYLLAPQEQALLLLLDGRTDVETLDGKLRNKLRETALPPDFVHQTLKKFAKLGLLEKAR